jgi:myosin heavy subunit
VVDAITANSQLLKELLNQVRGEAPTPVAGHSSSKSSANDDATLDNSDALQPHDELQAQRLQDEVAELQQRSEEQARELERRQNHILDLTNQIEDLAAQVAQSGVRKTVQSDQSCSNDALSWEERKTLILQQMEDGDFDAEAFVESIGNSNQGTDETGMESNDPSVILDQLIQRLQQTEAELADRKIEIGELQMLLDQQSETREGGVAIGAAAIASMVDSDELVAQERQRLQTLQDQWEAKFRQSEIEASLERAKLSRERRELAKRTENLEEELEHLRREARMNQEPNESGTSRRWMAKLGLAGDD